MNFIDAVKSAYSNFANFSGRAQRSAYWWFTLFNFIVFIVLTLAEGGGSFNSGDGSVQFLVVGGLFSGIWSLVNFIPGLSLSVRRMHDLDKSGWWLLILLVPLIGAIVVLVWFCARGTIGANRFGSDPLENARAFA